MLSETAPLLEPLQHSEKIATWKCPECNLDNNDNIAQCVCGYNLNKPAPQIILRNPEFAAITTSQNTEVAQQPEKLSLHFSGSAHEYFRIWIVNLCLTLLTLGIFSAWAKVRKKRYFYSNTILDKTPFQYLGRPIPIFKGRMIAGILFLTYYISSHFVTSLLPYVLAIGLLLAPWVLVRSAAFNARYSAFRNMTFQFDGNYLNTLKILYLWGLIPILVGGTIFEWWGKYIIAGIAFLIFGLVFPWWIKSFKSFIISHTSYGARNGTFFATGGQFFKIYFFAGLITIGIAIAAIGLSVLLGFIGFKKMQYLMIVIVVVIYVGYVLAYAYIQAHAGNLVWNHTRLGPLRFQSSLSARGLIKLYLSNALGIICSLGLLIPWAVMRTLKYRADHMHVFLEGSMSDFQGGETSAVQAIGAETMDFFDMDFSL
jgi:uncharacterized membrane protein YjgN (DUF898 family)